MKITGPGLGLVTFADSDLAQVDQSWFCAKNELFVDSAHALRVIEEQLYRLGARRLLELPFP